MSSVLVDLSEEKKKILLDAQLLMISANKVNLGHYRNREKTED